MKAVKVREEGSNEGGSGNYMQRTRELITKISGRIFFDPEISVDKREFVRKISDHPALIEIMGTTDRKNKIFMTRVANYSAGGALFELKNTVPVGTYLKITLALIKRSNGNTFEKLSAVITAQGRVVRNEPGRMAVLFSEEIVITTSMDSIQPGEIFPEMTMTGST